MFELFASRVIAEPEDFGFWPFKRCKLSFAPQLPLAAPDRLPDKPERAPFDKASIGGTYQMSKAKPFIKWAGGKRQLLPEILSRLPATMNTYFEPFVGGGAVFYALHAKGSFLHAVINDLNSELITTYRTLSDPILLDEVVTLLKGYPYEKEFYDDLRTQLPVDLSDSQVCARFIYLNHVGFNGLYRVNKRGAFNVPFGTFVNPKICDEENLRLVSEALRLTKVTCTNIDFEKAVESAQEGDVVYFDPPYLPVSPTAKFTEYLAGGFGLQEHERLAACVRTLAGKGVKVLLSNSDTATTRRLYEGFAIDTVSARRAINSKGDARGPVSEVLIKANLLVAVPLSRVVIVS